ncbi:MAG: hypothetical protein NXI31_12445 [bacterium]|nr:hypothetical protein [bacterium]
MTRTYGLELTSWAVVAWSLVAWLGSCAVIGAQNAAAHPEPALPARSGGTMVDRFGPAAPAVLRRSGALWAVGRDYKARFDAAGVEFVPAFGAVAPHNLPVRIACSAIGRESGLQLVERVEPQAFHDRIEFRRRAATERYEVRREGLAQSFVFERLPTGVGDLIVRCALATELDVTAVADGLRLERAGIGGLTIMGVAGIDAAGRRVAGAIRRDDDAFELVLPAAFVESAELPLVLDPLIGSVFHSVATNLDDRDPDVAYDHSNDLYLVVFQRVYSAADHDIHGQRVARDGTLVGGRIHIELSTSGEFDPAVANVNDRDTFVLVYDRGSDIKARGVAAATGAVSPEIDIASGADSQIRPDIGGEATTVDDEAICVWWNSTQDRIEAKQINVTVAGVLGSFDHTVIYESATQPPSNPRISQGGGRTGHHMIVFEQQLSVSNHDPAYRIVDRNLTLLETNGRCTTASDDQLRPAVDGDGRVWIVAWQTQEGAVPSKDDIVCRAVSWDPQESPTGQSAFLTGVVPITTDPNDAESAPTVVMTGESALVGWTDQDGSNTFNTYVRSIDSLTCVPCESTVQSQIAGAFPWDYQLAGCSDASGGGAGDDALLVIESYDAGGASVGDVLAQRWQCVDGRVTDVGGGCGSDEGQAYAACAIHGNGSFRASVVSELTFAPCWLVVSRDQRGVACGLSCRLVPDPYTGFLVASQTGGAGQASYAAALPSTPIIVGASFYMQWLVFEPLSPGCLLYGSDMTNAIRMTIE